MEIHADLEPGCSQQRSGKLCLLDPWNKGTSSSLPAQPSSSPASLRAQAGISEVPPRLPSTTCKRGSSLELEDKRIYNQSLGTGKRRGGKKASKSFSTFWAGWEAEGGELWVLPAPFTGCGNWGVSQNLLSPLCGPTVGRG